MSFVLESATKHASDPTAQARFYEYSKAADPVRPSLTPPIEGQLFAPTLYVDGPTRVVPLDMSASLKCEGPATGPGLCANFVRIRGGETIDLAPIATSMIFYVIRGSGRMAQDGGGFDWAAGDFFSAPALDAMVLRADEDAALYYVNDAPLLRYLGVRPDCARFAPTLYKAERANAELDKVANEPGAAHRNRVSVLLGHEAFPQTLTVTHTLWAMYGLISAGEYQKPHRHQSIALDYIVDCDPGVYSVMGRELDADGNIRNPERVDWQPGCAFITPPGMWHAHINESGRAARLIPIQDAGLQTYLRSLDIRFA
jgi:gentisate 1,2-dioxygenase